MTIQLVLTGPSYRYLMKKIILKKGREASLLRRHPWLFSGAVDKLKGEPGSGESVLLTDNRGSALAVAAYSPQSQIRARIWSFDTDEAIDENFFSRRINAAIARRQPLLNGPEREACRLIYAESDGLPGLIVDRYGDFLVCQFLTAGTEAWKPTIVQLLSQLLPCRGIYERSDVATRSKEGLPETRGVLTGETPPDTVVISEWGCRFGISVQSGHKTGFYLDQADNRCFLKNISADKSVLNCFSYTGGFGIAALRGGARHVTNVDSSASALQQATNNMELNEFNEAQYTNVCDNAFEVLRHMKREHMQFDIVVLDPPKFAEGKSQVTQAARAYKDIALQACSLVSTGGLLFTFSCSGNIDMNLFQKITADAFIDAGRSGQILHYLYQSEDHPIALPFPESLYLKGLVCRVE